MTVSFSLCLAVVKRLNLENKENYEEEIFKFKVSVEEVSTWRAMSVTNFERFVCK